MSSSAKANGLIRTGSSVGPPETVPEAIKACGPPRTKAERVAETKKNDPRLRQDLDEKCFDDNGKLVWPPREGFEGPKERITIKPSDNIILERFHSKPGAQDQGAFFSPAGTPYEERALPYQQDKMMCTRYRVVKEIPGVERGAIAPAFGQKGGGTQYAMPMTVSDLLIHGFIEPCP